MKQLFYLLPVLLFLACGGTTETTELPSEDVTETIQDTTSLDTISENVFIYTAEAAIDGPEEELWIFEPGSWNGGAISKVPDSYEVLHVIPYGDDENELSNEMSYINKNGFSLWEPFNTHTGPVVLFYDRAKTSKAAEFEVINGQPEGIASVYKQDGSIYIQERYAKGRMMEAIVYPYSVDWTFSQKESKLWIEDPISKGSKNSKGQPQQKISYSIREAEPGDNKLVQIMEKESFTKPFQINNQVFTGTLLAYEEPSGVAHESTYFELNFKNGLLHGDIKVFFWWGDLKLHEIFVDGNLDSTVYVVDESETDGLAKPIIYLYPEKETKVKVELDLKGTITHSYPVYNNAWQVLAKPDGTLLDATGKEYYALYWEGDHSKQFNVTEGFIIPGNQTAEFLEKSLAVLGLNRREANEFIIYWLPVLENNAFNLIHFSTKEYEEMAALKISPKPETIIRVMMVYKPLQEPINIPLQDLSKLKIERKGFTVVEWGGSLLKKRIEL